MNKGKIVQIIGPVVDAEFTEQLPAIYNALTVEYELDGETAKLTLEVQQQGPAAPPYPVGKGVQ